MDFLDELGNFKQKNFTLQNVSFFYILQQQTLSVYCTPKLLSIFTSRKIVSFNGHMSEHFSNDYEYYNVLFFKVLYSGIMPNCCIFLSLTEKLYDRCIGMYCTIVC